jgi:hypothetical protein
MTSEEAIERLAAALTYFRESGLLATRNNTNRIAARFMVHPVSLRKALRMEAELTLRKRKDNNKCCT